MNETLTAIPGFWVGHAQDVTDGLTGCTVIICPPGTVGGVDQRGGAPGTRETDLLRPMHLVQHVDAVFLAGGSAFGLAAGDGVMRYMEEQGRGFPTRAGHVPIVPGAILYDLELGNPKIRPDAAMGYAACQNASAEPVPQGTVGAGTGARVGGMLGLPFAMKGGLGSAAIQLESGLIVAALFAVNAAGDIVNEDGSILAGVRRPPEGEVFADSLTLLKAMPPTPPPVTDGNTVIGVVATNAQLSKEEVNKVAQMAHDGLARAVRPAHLPFDGDTIFALASGTHPAALAVVGALAAEVTAQAIRNGVRLARGLGGLPAVNELPV